MWLNSAVSVSTMATKSQTPYSGPDLITTLPTELLERIGSSLDTDSIKALRLTNRDAAAKTHFLFVKTCYQSVTIDMTKIGVRRALLCLRSNFVSISVKHMSFTSFITSAQWVRKGFRPNSPVDLPANSDIERVLNHLPNVDTVVLRDINCISVVSQAVCEALAAAPRAKLTDLTLDGCIISKKTLQDLLNAHRQTLRYLCISNVTVTEGSFTYTFLNTLKDFGLTRLVLDHIVNNRGKHFRVYKEARLRGIRMGSHRYEGVQVHEYDCGKCEKLQRYLLREESASMTGHAGVQEGIAKILKFKGR
jgi:hypothetical protein